MAAKKMTAKPKAAKTATPPAAAATSAAKPKFGSPAWNAKYGIGGGKKKSGK